MHIRVGDRSSQPFPDPVERALRALLKVPLSEDALEQAPLTEDALEQAVQAFRLEASKSQDGDIATVCEMGNVAIVAQGVDLVEAIREGILERFRCPLHKGEKLSLHADRGGQ